MHIIKELQVHLLFLILQEGLLSKIFQNGSNNWKKTQHKILLAFLLVQKYFILGNKSDLTEMRGVKLEEI